MNLARHDTSPVLVQNWTQLVAPRVYEVRKDSYIRVMKTTLLFVVALISSLTLLTACETAPTASSTHPELQRPDKTFEQIQMKYTYKNLKLHDLDQMMDLMYEKTKEYKTTDQIQKLKEGALIAFSRPDEDRTLDKVISIVKNPLEDSGEWENTVEAMVQQTISKLNNEKEDPSYQATAGVVLENLIADMKPLFIKQYRSGGFETDMIEKIADSNVKYSKATQSDRKLNLMRTNSSPSEIAARLIAIKNENLKQEKK